MIVLGYVGSHAKDGLLARLGWAITRLVQRGAFARVTHVEAYYGKDQEGLSVIGSSSLRDGGVRIKHTRLDPNKWVAVDVPCWDAARSMVFIQDRQNSRYDWRGAVATVFLNGQDANRWFCNEIVGASVGLVSPGTFGPAQFMAVALSMPGAKLIPMEDLP